MITRRHMLQLGAATAALQMVAPALARSGSFPAAIVKVVVPYSAGGPTDTLARLLTQRLSEIWNTSVLVDYKPGAGTMIGVAHVSQAAADGTTIGIVNSAFVINPLLHKTTPYEVANLAPVTQLVDVPLVLAANVDTPYDTLPELVAYARKNPEAMNYGTPGIGGTSHLAGLLLNRVADIRLTHVAYKGSAGAHTDVIGGQIPLLIDPLLSVLPQARAGRMKIIAVLSGERVRSAAELPTVAETYPGFDVSTFLGLIVPKGVHASIVDAISNAVAEGLAVREVQDKIEALGMFVKTGGPESFGRLLADEADKWADIIREQNISA